MVTVLIIVMMMLIIVIMLMYIYICVCVYTRIYIAIQEYIGIIVAPCDYIPSVVMFKITDMGIPSFRQGMSSPIEKNSGTITTNWVLELQNGSVIENPFSQ